MTRTQMFGQCSEASLLSHNIDAEFAIEIEDANYRCFFQYSGLEEAIKVRFYLRQVTAPMRTKNLDVESIMRMEYAT